MWAASMPRACRMVASLHTMQRRTMAGGFPPSMAIKKNKCIEEWNGKREITEKTFAINYKDVGTFVFYVILIPFGIYAWSRAEFVSKGDRRYKDML